MPGSVGSGSRLAFGARESCLQFFGHMRDVLLYCGRVLLLYARASFRRRPGHQKRCCDRQHAAADFVPWGLFNRVVGDFQFRAGSAQAIKMFC